MLTTDKLIELIRKDNAKNGLPTSDYYVAKTLGVTRQSIGVQKARSGIFNDETGLKAASVLGLNPEYVLACLHAERARNEPSAPVWRRIAHRLEGAAAAAFIFAITLNLPIF